MKTQIWYLWHVACLSFVVCSSRLIMTHIWKRRIWIRNSEQKNSAVWKEMVVCPTYVGWDFDFLHLFNIKRTQFWTIWHPVTGKITLHAVPFFSLNNWETGASEMRACASRSLQSLNYCGREKKKGTACSLGRVLQNSPALHIKLAAGAAVRLCCSLGTNTSWLRRSGSSLRGFAVVMSRQFLLRYVKWSLLRSIA